MTDTTFDVIGIETDSPRENSVPTHVSSRRSMRNMTEAEFKEMERENAPSLRKYMFITALAIGACTAVLGSLYSCGHYGTDGKGLARWAEAKCAEDPYDETYKAQETVRGNRRNSLVQTVKNDKISSVAD